MSFWQKYEDLCKRKGVTPSGAEMVSVLGVSSAGITYWKQKNSAPKEFEIYRKLAKYFDVDIRYLLGVSDSMYGEDIIEDMTDRMSDCGAEIDTFDNNTGIGKEYTVLYKGTSYRYQDHEFSKLCQDLNTRINDAAYFTTEKFCQETFGSKSITHNIDPTGLSKQELEFIVKYRLLTFEGKTMVNAKLVEELRRQE